MTARRLLLCVAAALALALGAVTTACDDDGDGGGEELTLQEYFEEIKDLHDEAAKKADEIEADLDEKLDSAEALDELASVFGESIDAFRDHSASFRDDLEKISPPAEAESAHDAMVSAFDEGVKALESLDVGDVESEADLTEMALGIAEEFGDLVDKTVGACLVLQAVADDNNVNVDLDCMA